MRPKAGRADAPPKSGEADRPPKAGEADAPPDRCEPAACAASGADRAAGGDAAWIPVCESSRLADGGDGVRFELPRLGREPLAAFAVRVGGTAHAYLNRCAHVAVELDWMPGRFLDESGRFIVCATHGALYHAHTGACAGGPCRGVPLVALAVREAGGRVEVAAPGAARLPTP